MPYAVCSVGIGIAITNAYYIDNYGQGLDVASAAVAVIVSILGCAVTSALAALSLGGIELCGEDEFAFDVCSQTSCGRLIFRLDVTNPKGKSVCIIAEVADLENSEDLTRSVLSKLENLRKNSNAESARYARPTEYR